MNAIMQCMLEEADNYHGTALPCVHQHKCTSVVSGVSVSLDGPRKCEYLMWKSETSTDVGLEACEEA